MIKFILFIPVENNASIVPLSHSLEITKAVKSIPIKFMVIAKEPGRIKWWELISWLYQKRIIGLIKGFLVWYLKSDISKSQELIIELA